MSADFIVWGKLIDGIVNSNKWKFEYNKVSHLEYLSNYKILLYKCYWGFYLEDSDNYNWYRRFRMILNIIETGKSKDERGIPVSI